MAVVDSDNYCTTINDEKRYLLEARANKTKPAEVRGRFFYCRLKWLINNKGATLVLIMVTLVNIFDQSVAISSTHLSEANLSAAYSGCSIFFYLFYPITGLYADIKFGRYKTGFAALCVALCSSLLMIMGLMLSEAKIMSIPYYFSFSLYSIGYILGNFARHSFLIVILSFGVDQMVGASGEQLSAFAQWYYFCWITGWTVSVPILCLAKGSEHSLFGFYGSHVFCIVVALIIMVSLKRSGMVTESQITTNPVSMIVNILRYAKNNKYPRNRSALTYWENDYPSRLDLAIQKYGGPFSEEQVQDFKTLLRVLPLIICMLVFFVTADGYHLFLPQPGKEKFPHCLTSSVYFINSATIIITMLVHQIILYPLLYKYYPTMLQKIGIGIFLCIVAEVSFLVIDLSVSSSKTTTGCLLDKFSNATYNYWETHDLFIMIPKLISGVALGTAAPTTLEFAFAQAPYSMRGVIVGVWFMAVGCLQTVGFSLKYPFRLLRNSYPSCESFYLFTTKFLIVGLSFFCFVLLSLHYKLRFRGDQYNQHQTVVKYYTKYLNHEEENGSVRVWTVLCIQKMTNVVCMICHHKQCVTEHSFIAM